MQRAPEKSADIILARISGEAGRFELRLCESGDTCLPLFAHRRIMNSLFPLYIAQLGKSLYIFLVVVIGAREFEFFIKRALASGPPMSAN
jgi:hypothetical protein